MRTSYVWQPGNLIAILLCLPSLGCGTSAPAPQSEMEPAPRSARAMPTQILSEMPPASDGTWTVPSSEAYDHETESSPLAVRDQPLSTFSIDTDTASYSNIRRYLQQHQLPPADAVRIEECLNYFNYNHPSPDGETPFATHAEVASCPWNPQHRLAMIGIQGRRMANHQRPASNLVFLLDVSGSMNHPKKLPLVQESMRLLVDQLGETDHLAIVVYAGAAGVVLPSTSATRKPEIRRAIDRLRPQGSTNGALGIRLAYDIALENFIKDGVNRVILCTDGDFNVGITNRNELTDLITTKAKSGVFLSVLGFGMGNLKDATMESLADRGNGNYAYIDGPAEARKVLVDQMTGTLVTIAKDVKIQVEFNPQQVAGYRLIGYDNRRLANRDFHDDTKDAGEIGAGHCVTAFYEIVPAGQALVTHRSTTEALKYQHTATQDIEFTTPPNSEIVTSRFHDELFTIKLRYKQPASDVSQKLEIAVSDRGTSFGQATGDFRFASAVALFGMMLKNSPYRGGATWNLVQELSEGARDSDPTGQRSEFIDLVRRAQSLQSERRVGIVD